MKSRMAIALVLTVGMLLSMTGAGLALSGSSGSGSAASNQYPPNDPKDPKAALSSHDPAVQRTAQVSARGGSLPFTGYASIPILVGGIALLGTGLVLRRRTTNE